MTAAARLLFVTLTNDVGSDRIVNELGRHGAVCAVLGPSGNFAGLNRCIERRFIVPSLLGTWVATWFFRHRLAGAVRDWRPDRIVPLDELAALSLRSIATAPSTDGLVREILDQSFGDAAGYRAACHRLALMEVAGTVGVRTPAFGPMEEGLVYPLVVKRDHSSGGGGVTIVSTARRLPVVLRKAAVLRVVKRLMARAAGYDHGPGPILLQRFISGTLAMRTVVADRGRVLDGISMRAVQSHPEKRASTILEPLDCPEMDGAARKLVAALGCSGFVSFDFMLDASGAAHLIEMNPRPIGSTHLGRLFGHDLARAFLTGRGAESGRSVVQPSLSSVALFPKELERDPSGGLLDADAGRRHDVPRDEPRVVQAYADYLQALHPSWSDAIRRRLGHTETATGAEVLPAGSRLSGASP